MNLKKSVRIVKKIHEGRVWKFVALRRNGTRYVWDDRPGTYFLDWWENGERHREVASLTPSQALTAQRRKRAELIGALVLNGKGSASVGRAPTPPVIVEEPEEEHKHEEGAQPEKTSTQTPLIDTRKLFLAHVAAHSPDKPETQRRYRQVMEHFERLFRHRSFAEAITRADIDDYKINRLKEKSQRTRRLISARTVNFEVGVLRTFFYYLIGERNLDRKNPCAKFKKGEMQSRNREADRQPTARKRSMPSLRIRMSSSERCSELCCSRACENASCIS